MFEPQTLLNEKTPNKGNTELRRTVLGAIPWRKSVLSGRIRLDLSDLKDIHEGYSIKIYSDSPE